MKVRGQLLWRERRMLGNVVPCVLAEMEILSACPLACNWILLPSNCWQLCSFINMIVSLASRQQQVLDGELAGSRNNQR